MSANAITSLFLLFFAATWLVSMSQVLAASKMATIVASSSARTATCARAGTGVSEPAWACAPVAAKAVSAANNIVFFIGYSSCMWKSDYGCRQRGRCLPMLNMSSVYLTYYFHSLTITLYKGGAYGLVAATTRKDDTKPPRRARAAQGTDRRGARPGTGPHGQRGPRTPRRPGARERPPVGGRPARRRRWKARDDLWDCVRLFGRLLHRVLPGARRRARGTPRTHDAPPDRVAAPSGG